MSRIKDAGELILVTGIQGRESVHLKELCADGVDHFVLTRSIVLATSGPVR